MTHGCYNYEPVDTPDPGPVSDKIYPKTIIFMLAHELITVGTNKANEIILDRSGVIIKAYMIAKTPPTGNDLIADINVNGTSIWNTNPSNRLRLLASNAIGTQDQFDTTSVSEGDVFSIDIDQTGSIQPGQDVTIQLLLLVQNT